MFNFKNIPLFIHNNDNNNNYYHYHLILFRIIIIYTASIKRLYSGTFLFMGQYLISGLISGAEVLIINIEFSLSRCSFGAE